MLMGWWVGGLVGWWIGGLVDWWVGGLVGWWIGGLVVEEIRGKIRELRIKPAFLRCLGPYVTKEELESIYQKNESVTRIFEKMLLFSNVCFQDYFDYFDLEN